MLRRFFKRLLIGAAALAASILVVKVAKKILAPKKATEVASDDASPLKNVKPFRAKAQDLLKTVDVSSDAVVLVVAEGAAEPANADSLQQLREVYDRLPYMVRQLASFENFLAEVMDPAIAQYTLKEMEAVLWAEEERQAKLEAERQAKLEAERQERAAMFSLIDRRIQFDGIYEDDFLIPGLHSRTVPSLRSQTLKLRTAGTREFYAAYAYLGKEVAQAHLEPRQRLKTTVEEDHAIQARARLFDLPQPMDIDKLQNDMFGHRTDENEFLKKHLWIMKRQAYKSEAIIARTFPPGWAHHVGVCMTIILEYIEGYTDEAKDRFKLYLAALVITRNRVWGLPDTDVSLYIAPALFRYCVNELRRLIWTEESLQEAHEDPEMEPYTKEDAAEYFERFLNEITLPHPTRGDVLRHTPMRLVKHLTLDMERVDPS